MDTKRARWLFPKRYLIVVMLFFGYMNIFYLHSNLGMALVDMTTEKSVTLQNGTITKKADFSWNSTDKGHIISSFAYGRLFGPVGGFLAGKVGGGTIYAIGILVTSMITLLSPIFVHISFDLFFIINVIFGVFEAFSYAGGAQLCSRWAPPDERAKFVSFSLIGSYFGSAVSFVVSGWILATWGWRVLFYVSGTASFVLFCIWVLVVRDDPADDKCMTEAERRYIQEKVNITNSQEKLVYPWKDILTCMPFWAGCMVKFAIGIGHTFTFLYLPQYIQDTNNIDIKKIGFISMIPQICAIISTPISGCISDYIRSNKILSYTTNHKLFVSIGLFSSALGYAVLVSCSNFTIRIIAIAASKFLSTFAIMTAIVMFLDLAPRYASLLTSTGTTFFTSSGIITPILVGHVVTSRSIYQWNICFVALSGSCFGMAVLYLIFGSGKLQSWANYSPRNNEPKVHYDDEKQTVTSQ